MVSPIHDAAAPSAGVAVAHTDRDNKGFAAGVVAAAIFPVNLALEAHVEEVFILDEFVCANSVF